MTAFVHVGDALSTLRTLPSESVNCCITSPPYWGLRDYGVDGQLGQEATLPDFLASCVLAGCPIGGVVLDPFTGSGTTGMVAVQHGRSFVGIELNPEYAAMANARIAGAGAEPER